MDPTTLRLIQGAAGAADDATYVDDVFSTFLYDGNGSTKTIPNGIDLAGEGGLVWTKNRTSATFADHIWVDSERGNFYLKSNNTDPNNGIASFNFASTGYTVPANSRVNTSSVDYASWSFRKAPGFFDVVTYTGTGSNRTVAHNLKSTPGMMIVKCTNTGGTNWLVYHTSLGPTKAEILDLTTGPVGPSANYWNNTAPTSTEFTVGISNDVNTDGDTYIAYLFANDEPVFGTNEDESIIKCGTYTGSGAAGKFVDVGFEPQWVLIKCTSEARDWVIRDNMRVGKELYPNLTDADKDEPYFDFSANGFTLQDSSARHNKSGATYIYIAIRRPNKPPESATEVYKSLVDNDATATATGFTVDMALGAIQSGNSFNHSAIDRFRNRKVLKTNLNSAQTVDIFNDNSFATNDGMNGRALLGTGLYHFFKRAPGFFDMVEYDGNATAGRTVTHNLESVPEFIICKCKNDTAGWWCYHKDLTTNYAIRMDGASNGNVAEQSVSNYWNSSTHSSTTFTLGDYGDLNGTSKAFISYLFATLPGISKVGIYSGTGNAVDVDCGFTAGARFVMIKRKNGAGGWYVWNTATGIGSGDDPYLLLNTDAAEVTNTDYIDPLASGFTVTSSAPDALNVDGGTYLFLAIA